MSCVPSETRLWGADSTQGTNACVCSYLPVTSTHLPANDLSRRAAVSRSFSPLPLLHLLNDHELRPGRLSEHEVNQMGGELTGSGEVQVEETEGEQAAALR